MSDAGLRYTFTCPSCSGNYSILLERVPPVRARFRCPHCNQPMDFPSRDEARVYARLQEESEVAVAVGGTDPPPVPVEAPRPAAAPRPVEASPGEAGGDTAGRSFRIEKQGFENDVFDRRGIRNLIRTGEVSEQDFVSVDGAAPTPAGQVAFLKSLFKLRSTSTVTPPPRCRTHTDLLAFYKCQDTARPLCEDCAPEKKFGSAIARVCSHCGGTATELTPPEA